MIFKRIAQGLLSFVMVALATSFIGLIAKVIWLLFIFGFNAI